MGGDISFDLPDGYEVEQQASMLGLPKEAWSSPLFEELLPSQVLRRV